MNCFYNSDNLYLYNSKINNNNNNNVSFTDDCVLYQNNNIFKNQEKNANNVVGNNVYVLPLKNNIDINENYIQNINRISSPNSNNEQIMKNDECAKNNTSIHNCECCNCSFKNCDDKNIDLSKSRISKKKSPNSNQKNLNNGNKSSSINMNSSNDNYTNDDYKVNDDDNNNNNNKLQNMDKSFLNTCKIINQNKKKNVFNINNENNSEINNNPNNICIINKKAAKCNNEQKNNYDICPDSNSNYPNVQKTYKGVYSNENIANNFINNYCNYEIPVKKKLNEDHEESLNKVTSVNEIITNIREMLQNNTSENANNKKLENSTNTKLIKLNYFDKNNNINKNGDKNINNYMESMENGNYNLLYNKDSDKYNFINNNEKNNDEIVNALEKQNPYKLNNNDTLLLLKNLSNNYKFSYLKNIQEEQFDYLKQNDDTIKNSNFFSDVHIETNIDDPSGYSKKKNQANNFQSEETFNYEIDKTEIEELKENEKIKKGTNFEECEKCDDGEHKKNKDKYIRANNSTESKKGKEDYFNENYQRKKENDGNEMYEDEGYEEDEEEDEDEEEEKEKEKEKDINENGEETAEEEYCEELSEHSNEEKKNIKIKLNNEEYKDKNQKKIKNYTKKNLLKNSCELQKPEKNVHDNFSESKNKLYIGHNDNINEALFNLNNPNIDEFTKNKLLDMRKKPFLSDKNGKMHIFHEGKKQMQNGTDNKCFKKAAKNENDNFDNLKKNKNILKNSCNVFNYDKVLKELKKENSKEFFEKNEKLQHIIKKYQENNFFSNLNCVYENQSYDELRRGAYENKENNLKNKNTGKNMNVSVEKIGNEESSNENFDEQNSTDIKNIEKKYNIKEKEKYKRSRVKVNNNEDNEERRKSTKIENKYDKKIEEKMENLNTNKQSKEILCNDNDIYTQKSSKNEVFTNTHLIDNDSRKKENCVFLNEKHNFSTDVEKSQNKKNYFEEEKLENECEDDEEDGNNNGTCSVKKYDSDYVCNKNFHKTLNNEKKQKIYMCDVMKSNDLKKINDNYFKLHSNLASNLLSTSTSSSYSNDNVKMSLNNYEMSKLSSNTCINKFLMEDEMYNNLNMNDLRNKSYSLFDNNKKIVEEKTSVSLDNNSTNNETNVNEYNNNNNNNDSNEEGAIKNKEILIHEIQKNVIKEIEIENKLVRSSALNNQFINKERVISDNKVIKKKEIKDKLKNEEIINESENHIATELNKNDSLSQHLHNNNLVCNKDILLKNLSKINSEELKSYDTLMINANKYYKNNLQLKRKMLFKNKSYSDNDNFLNIHLKRKMSSYSDFKESDTFYLKKHKLLTKHYAKEEEFLLNRTSSLNISLNKLGEDILKDDKKSNDNNNIEVIKEKKMRQNVINNSGLQEESSNIQTKKLSEDLNENETVIKNKEENIDNKKEETSEIFNAVESTVKNKVDKKVCTLVNCPTHNPQNYTKSMSKKNDSQGDSALLKEENDELKRITGVYYDKNSQRWFGEHKINGVKCAQSFAVKKHGCEEAKRLAIEWKKARIRGEVWDRFINKKKRNNNNSCLKVSKSSRPSVEELRMKYLSMSKNMPKVRGVWFNSTPQRMGWVGQAYKKCKRIERIFSVNKYGFEGARKLAIAFRNSQKPSNEDSDEDNWSKDDKMNIKNNEDNLNNYEYKNTFLSSINNIKNNNKMETKDIRINLCRDAILFILQDLETILELNIPLLNKNVNIYKICIKHHLNYLALIKSEEQIIPYLTVFGDYIQRCILPTDLPYAELYVLIDSLIHNETLPSFDHKQNFCEYSVTEDPGIITPSMLL